jgi:hypothetical protein
MSASQKITEYIQKNPDWKGNLIHQIRELILKTEPNIEEEWKWNNPVWSINGMVCSIGTFKKHISLTFFKGADLEKETNLFNSPSVSKNTRSIIWKENDELTPEPLKVLLQKAVGLNS